MDVNQGSHPVKVSEETWRELNAQKHPGDTFEDVIQRLLNET
ncbi:antitoxin VapB family protein [Halobacterium sp. BOL4-2]|nr:antitoxin VapB family protein [Halobacterium sp. BOL4-2]UDF60579.1 antitoxin VapB family protein [Halobacterium sp. BOL4-2]